MSNTVVLGMQWGDEGKGKIVDLISPAFDVVARYQGGHNAGHTVKYADRHFSLHLIPSGILQSEIACVLGNGMVIEPDAFFTELERLAEAGVEAGERLYVSDRAHVILPLHAALDQAREAAGGDGKIGTTCRGIGPAYEMKASRHGLRIGELGAVQLEARLEVQLARVAPELAALGADPPPELAALADTCRGWAERLAPHVTDTARLLNGWISSGQSVLFEGAQGALLDVDHGTYPFVTSSNAVAGGVCTGTGVPPTRIDGTIGVIKAYTTRVGSGPFPTELFDATGAYLRKRGNEFGTTTGRPRRCGWFDAVVARHACLLNGVDALALTKLDVLDELDEIAICTGYRHQDADLRHVPADTTILDAVEPVYRTVKGWKQKTVGALELDDLPRAARDFLAVLQEETGVPVAMISTGPRREETILLAEGPLERLLSGRLEEVRAHRGVG